VQNVRIVRSHHIAVLGQINVGNANGKHAAPAIRQKEDQGSFFDACTTLLQLSMSADFQVCETLRKKYQKDVNPALASSSQHVHADFVRAVMKEHEPNIVIQEMQNSMLKRTSTAGMAKDVISSRRSTGRHGDAGWSDG
jgi:hypothetical protein